MDHESLNNVVQQGKNLPGMISFVGKNSFDDTSQQGKNSLGMISFDDDTVQQEKNSFTELDILNRYRHPNLLRAAWSARYENYSLKIKITSRRYQEVDRLTYQNVIELIDVLAFLELNGYVHGDVKADNLLLDDDKLVLIDFNLMIRSHDEIRFKETQSYANFKELRLRSDMFYRRDTTIDLTYYTKLALWATAVTIVELTSRLSLDFIIERLDDEHERLGDENERFNIASEYEILDLLDPEISDVVRLLLHNSSFQQVAKLLEIRSQGYTFTCQPFDFHFVTDELSQLTKKFYQVHCVDRSIDVLILALHYFCDYFESSDNPDIVFLACIQIASDVLDVRNFERHYSKVVDIDQICNQILRRKSYRLPTETICHLKDFVGCLLLYSRPQLLKDPALFSQRLQECRLLTLDELRSELDVGGAILVRDDYIDFGVAESHPRINLSDLLIIQDDQPHSYD